ncbi:MAG: DUF2877 domain-containing protein, partial [Spirochaetota bacterium]
EEPLLISLVLRTRDMTDLAVHVSDLPRKVKPGDRITWSDSSDAAGEAIATNRADGWTGAVTDCADTSVVHTPTNGAEKGRQTAAVRSALIASLAEAATPESFRGVVLERDENVFAGRAREVAAARELGSLVGLGIGFTPSGDDFLAGVLLAAALFDGSGAISQAERRQIAANLGRTTPGGRTLLWLALQGSFPAYLLEFAAAVVTAVAAAVGTAGERSRRAGGAGLERHGRGDGGGSAGALRRLRHACETAFRHGETSGMDAISGFTWYLQRPA